MATVYHMHDLGPVLSLGFFICMEDEPSSTSRVSELTGHQMSYRTLTSARLVCSACGMSGTHRSQHSLLTATLPGRRSLIPIL